MQIQKKQGKKIYIPGTIPKQFGHLFIYLGGCKQL